VDSDAPFTLSISSSSADAAYDAQDFSVTGVNANVDFEETIFADGFESL